MSLHKTIGKVRSRTLSEINNAVIWSEVAREALKEKAKDAKFIKAGKFPVPSHKPNRAVNRDERQIQAILTEAATTKLYWSVLVYLVSRTESAISEILKALLRSDPRRLLIEATGKKLEFRTVIESGDYATLLEQMIATHLHDSSYLRPSQQMEYFQKVTGIEVDTTLIADWIEIKATRDILVHNDGVANAIYEGKAAQKSRVAVGKSLPIDPAYFKHAAVTMKLLIGRICWALQKDSKPKKSSSKA